MQATNGFAALARSRSRLIGCSMAIVLALFALVLALAPTANAATPQHPGYLALGDSISFGYSQELFNENFPTENPEAFERGFVNDYLENIKAATHEKWQIAANDGCPGETSDSAIGTGLVGKTLENIIPGSHGAAPCAYHNVNGFPLHNEYASGQSQLENAIQVIKEKSIEGQGRHAVKTISLQIGSNDIIATLKKCEQEVAEGRFKEFGSRAFEICVEAHAAGVFTHVETNVAAMLFALRNGSLFGGVNYTGKIIEGGYYDPYGHVFNLTEELVPNSNVLDLLLNASEKEVVEGFGVCYADPQSSPANPALSFNPEVVGEPAEEPVRLKAWTNMGNFTFAVNGNKAKNGPDIHPTPVGYEKLAEGLKAECP